ncbi:MAG: hypothetical protein IID16_11475 [Candidatus Marinimicrobia bacterium]|nr:hypothetical protein [Candidatus Neomarinimicrobiota bacterium]
MTFVTRGGNPDTLELSPATFSFTFRLVKFDSCLLRPPEWLCRAGRDPPAGGDRTGVLFSQSSMCSER